MSIRDQAWQAFTSSQQSAIAAAEAALFDRLSGLTVTVELADVRADRQGRHTYIFTDGDVHLAAIDVDGWIVKAVEADPSGWAELSPPLGSLAELSPYVPPLSPDDPDAWVSGNLYPEGAVVTHAGQVWRSTVDGNHWEPGVVHSVWVLV